MGYRPPEAIAADTARLAQFLEDPHTVHEIAELLGCHRNYVSEWLAHMRAEGYTVVRHGGKHEKICYQILS